MINKNFNENVFNTNQTKKEGIKMTIKIIKLNNETIKVTNGKEYFTCEQWQFEDKETLMDMLQNGNFNMTQSEAEETANTLLNNKL